MIQNFYSWIELYARWSVLRSLGNSSLVRVSVLMPAFGYVLLLNDNVHQYLTVKYDGWLLQYLPNIWRIWFLFYGSFLLALGTILYSIFCPAQIKRYATPYEQAGAETEHTLQLGGHGGLKRDLQNLYESLTDREKKLFSLPKLKMDNAVDVDGYRRDISNGLIHSWLVRNVKQPLMRIAILAIYTVGLSMVAIPAVWTFCQVSLLALKHAVS